MIENGKITCLFNSPLDKSEKLAQLYSAHNTIWDNNGLSRAWGGISFETKNKEIETVKGDLIEEDQQGNLRITRYLKGMRPNLIKHPHHLVFFIQDDSFAIPSYSQLSVEDATDLFMSGLIQISNSTSIFSFRKIGTISKLQQGQRFKEFLIESNATVFVLNSSSSKLKEHLEEIKNGKLTSESWKGVYEDGKKGDLKKVLESIKTKISQLK